MRQVGGAQAFYENKVVGLTTKWVDPTAASDHVFDLKLYNTGVAGLFGGVMCDTILEAVGTKPLPQLLKNATAHIVVISKLSQFTLRRLNALAVIRST